MGLLNPSKTHTVRGILGLIDFHGSKVPVGFIISFKKSGHNFCNGQGFAILSSIAHPCTCAWSRAERELRKIGRTAFESASIKYASETQEQMYQESLRQTARERALSQIPVSTERHVQSDFEVGVIPEPPLPEPFIPLMIAEPPSDSTRAAVRTLHLSKSDAPVLLVDSPSEGSLPDLLHRVSREG